MRSSVFPSFGVCLAAGFALLQLAGPAAGQVDRQKLVAPLPNVTTQAQKLPPKASCPAQLPKLPADTYAAARETLQKSGFRVEARQRSSALPAGRIAAMQLHPSTPCLVIVDVSDGSLVKVPPVLEMSPEAARSRLMADGLVLRAQNRAHDSAAGLAFEQEPRAGTAVKRGSAVQAWFASPQVIVPPSSIPVPPVVGSARDNAERVLQQSGFRAQVNAAIENDAAPGTVFRQAPPAGTPARRGTAVVLDISAGIPVPAVTSRSFDEARRMLRRFAVEPRATSLENPIVVVQSPEPGSRAAAGSRVTLRLKAQPAALPPVVAQPEPKPAPQPPPSSTGVPLVVGHAQDDAARVLRQAGFRARANPAVDNDAAPGTVFSQAPAAGAPARRGTAVVLDISAGIAVPAVTEKTFEEARRMLARFSVEPRGTSLENPIVVVQSPQAGSRVAAGSRVTLRLEARPVAVPPVVAQPQPQPQPQPTPQPQPPVSAPPENAQPTPPRPVEIVPPQPALPQPEGPPAARPTPPPGDIVPPNRGEVVEPPPRSPSPYFSWTWLFIVVAGLGVFGFIPRIRRMFAPPPAQMRARARIDPASHVVELEGAELAQPALTIGVRLMNPRAEVIVTKEVVVHE